MGRYVSFCAIASLMVLFSCGGDEPTPTPKPVPVPDDTAHVVPITPVDPMEFPVFTFVKGADMRWRKENKSSTMNSKNT